MPDPKETTPEQVQEVLAGWLGGLSDEVLASILEAYPQICQVGSKELWRYKILTSEELDPLQVPERIGGIEVCIQVIGDGDDVSLAVEEWLASLSDADRLLIDGVYPTVSPDSEGWVIQLNLGLSFSKSRIPATIGGFPVLVSLIEQEPTELAPLFSWVDGLSEKQQRAIVFMSVGTGELDGERRFVVQVSDDFCRDQAPRSIQGTPVVYTEAAVRWSGVHR